MGTADGGHRDAATTAVADREYSRARTSTREPVGGCSQTRGRRRSTRFDPGDRGWVGVGLGYLLTATAAYRVAGADARASRREIESEAVARYGRRQADRMEAQID